MHIWNGGQYVIESKFRSSDYINVVTKIYDSYIKLSDELNLSGGFAVLYPKQLTTLITSGKDQDEVQKRASRLKYTAIVIFPTSDQRTTEQFVGTISELAEWINKKINQPSRVIEPDIEFIIEVLRRGSFQLKNALGGISSNSLVDIFGGKNVFRNVLQYEEKKYPVEEMMHAAAYILVNQIVFYHILSKYNFIVTRDRRG